MSRVGGARPAPHTYFVISAVSRYLAPAFAVLLFPVIAPLGVAWLRIMSAALVFALWRRFRPGHPMNGEWGRTIALGALLAAMNASFYLAIARLPLATVAAVEFLGPLCLALAAAREARNLIAVGLAGAGVYSLLGMQMEAAPIGVAFAVANAIFFAGYIVVGHRISGSSADRVDRLGIAMVIAAALILVPALPFAAPALTQPELLLAGFGLGVASSVVPYVCDQLAMARLARGTYALLVALLPATAAVVGVLVLRQRPSLGDVAGVALVIAGIGAHREPHAVSADAGSLETEMPPIARPDVNFIQD